jgi:hypothetical protein
MSEFTIIALIGWIVMKELREHMAKSSCDERVQLARREGRREAMNDYRLLYNEARSDAESDAIPQPKELK